MVALSNVIYVFACSKAIQAMSGGILRDGIQFDRRVGAVKRSMARDQTLSSLLSASSRSPLALRRSALVQFLAQCDAAPIDLHQ
jgi:hypothetical protein